MSSRATIIKIISRLNASALLFFKIECNITKLREHPKSFYLPSKQSKNLFVARLITSGMVTIDRQMEIDKKKEKEIFFNFGKLKMGNLQPSSF